MRDEAPALLFENIKDYQDGEYRRFFTGSLSTYGRIALMLGLPLDTPVREIIQTVRDRVKNPVKPLLVENGACKENEPIC